MVKVIGFMKKVDGYQTVEGKMKSDSFINACKMVAERTGVSFDTYHTKRQCSKFYRGQGIVFNELTR